MFRSRLSDDAVEAAVEVLESGWLGQGRKVSEFEQAFADYVGARHCVAVNTGTAALHLAVRTLSLPHGSEVVTTPMTWVATHYAVLYEGCRPILADVQPHTGNIAPEEIERKITPRTAALLVVHYSGYPCDLDAVREIAARHGLPCVTLPAGLMPRMALGLLVFPALSALAAAGVSVAAEADVDEALEVVRAQAADLGPDTPTDKNEAKRLALAIGQRLPVVYGGPLTGTVAYRWKTDLEENAKLLAVAGALPEMNHNEIEVWGGARAREMHAVLLREDGELAEIGRRFALVRELLGPTAGGVSEAWARGGSRFARLLSLVYLGQWVSYYAAMLRDTDPWPVVEKDRQHVRFAQPASYVSELDWRSHVEVTQREACRPKSQSRRSR